MAYTSINKPSDYFNTKLHTGNGSTQSITGINFQPDWVWIKDRGNATNHMVFDSVRGTGKELHTQNTDNETTQSDTLTAFGSDGFSLGSHADVNDSSDNYVSWNWKAGTSFTNDASATGIGTIDSTGSVNTDAGFSIVKWTGTTSNGTIAHGLGTTPSLFISKSMAGAHAWGVYHKSIGIGSSTLLNSNGASDADATYYGGTSPTSTTMGLGTTNATNASGDMIGYAFAEKQGYSKFGSYKGNGNADGTFVYTGFKPAFFICKRYNDAGYDWLMYDNKRQVSFNVIDDFLKPNLGDAETTGNANQSLDFLSNGVKHRGNGASSNGSGASYIYMAFAEHPFVSSTGTPVTAR